MAAMTSFKQQCPSCEAMVPIRDPNLIGRKIDCPKCKYRFVVEKPEKDEDEEETAPARKGARSAAVKTAPGKAKPGPRRRDEDDEEEDERPRKKQGGASMTVLLGAGLGGLALILLVVGGFFLFSGGGSSTNNPKNNNNASTGPATSSTTAPTPGATTAAPKVALTDVSNLLPNDSEAVINYQIDQLHDSGLGQIALHGVGAFREDAFKDTFSFPLYDADGKDGVSRIVTALSNSKNWVFTVVRTLKPVNKEQLTAALGLEEQPAVNGLVAYTVNRDFDSLGNLLIKANRRDNGLQLCILDPQTLVFADPEPMTGFLNAKGKPEYKTQPTAAAPPQNPAPSGTGPTAGSSGPPPGMSSGPPPGMSSGPPPGMSSGPPPGMSSGPPPGMSSGPPGSSTGMAPNGTTAPKPAAPAPTLVGTYLTINPDMKAMFDKLEKADQPALVSVVVSAKDPMVEALGRYIQGRTAGMELPKGVEDPSVRSALDQAKAAQFLDANLRWVGFSLTTFSRDQFTGAVAVDFGTDQLAKPIADKLQGYIGMANLLLSGGPAGANPMNPGNPFNPNPGGTPFPGGTTFPGGTNTSGPTYPGATSGTPAYPGAANTPGPPLGRPTPAAPPIPAPTREGPRSPAALPSPARTRGTRLAATRRTPARARGRCRSRRTRASSLSPRPCRSAPRRRA